MEDKILSRSEKRALKKKKKTEILDISDANLSVAIYIRVSTSMQVDGYSLEYQEDVCRKYAISRGWKENNFIIYREEGRSAKDDKRPVFQKMISDAENGLFQVLIVHRLDRFMRNMRLCSEYIGKLLNEDKVALIFFGDNLEFLCDNRSNIAYTMFAWFADYYSKNLSGEIQKARKTQSEQGIVWHKAPWGYIRQDKNCIPEQSKRDIIREAFELYATGDYSCKQIAEIFIDKGFFLRNGGVFTGFFVRTMLENRFYSGYIRYKDKYFLGQHEPVISDELFFKCQKALDERKDIISGRRNNPYLPIDHRLFLQNLLICNQCNRVMRIHTAMMENGDHKHYYRESDKLLAQPCVFAGKKVFSEIPEKQVEELLSKITLPEQWISKINSLAAGNDKSTSNKKEIAKLRRKFNLLDKEFIENDNLSDDAMKKNIETKKSLMLQIQNLEKSASAVNLTLNRQQVVFTSLCDHFTSATMPEKSEIAHLLFEALHFDYEKSRIISFTPKSDFMFIFEGIAVENGWRCSSEGKFFLE